MPPIYNQYDPGLVMTSFAGVLVQGFAKDEFISVERMEDGFSMDVGSLGDTTRVRNRNKNGSVTITLQAGAPTNDLLMARAALDELTGTGFGPLLIKDLNGTSVVESPIAWIRKIPNLERASGASKVEWVIDCFQLLVKVGSFIRL
jgi:hypothetical protein